MAYFSTLSPLGKRHKPTKWKVATVQEPLSATVQAASDDGGKVVRDQVPTKQKD